MQQIHGRCLCGEIRFAITGKTTEIGMCHCSKCRRVSGVASNANLMTGRDGLVCYWVPLGLLATDPGVRVAGHIYVGSKAPWDEIAGDCPQHKDGFGSRRLNKP